MSDERVSAFAFSPSFVGGATQETPKTVSEPERPPPPLARVPCRCEFSCPRLKLAAHMLTCDKGLNGRAGQSLLKQQYAVFCPNRARGCSFSGACVCVHARVCVHVCVCGAYVMCRQLLMWACLLCAGPLSLLRNHLEECRFCTEAEGSSGDLAHLE